MAQRGRDRVRFISRLNPQPISDGRSGFSADCFQHNRDGPFTRQHSPWSDMRMKLHYDSMTVQHGNVNRKSHPVSMDRTARRDQQTFIWRQRIPKLKATKSCPECCGKFESLHNNDARGKIDQAKLHLRNPAPE